MNRVDSVRADTAAALKCDLAGEVLRSFGPLHLPATGWSMLPAVWPEDTLVVEPVRQDQVRIGDVVVVGREGKLCAHRVIGVASDPESARWITQGDALPVPDRPVAGHELMGRVAYLIRAGKLIAVPAELSAAEQLVAKIVRRSAPAARVLVFLHRKVQVPKKTESREPVLPCQG